MRRKRQKLEFSTDYPLPNGGFFQIRQKEEDLFYYVEYVTKNGYRTIVDIIESDSKYIKSIIDSRSGMLVSF